MVIVQTRSFPLLKTSEVWFYDGAHLNINGKVLFNQSYVKPDEKVYRLKQFHTLALPLTETTDQLFARVNRTFRYHIRKGENLRLDYSLLNLNDEGLLQCFVESFNEFAARKNLLKMPEWRIHELVKARTFIVTFIKSGDNFLNMHGYLHDDHRTRLITSFPVKQAGSNNIHGYINKFHHWRDILFFKEKGFSWYDFGGISADQNDGRSYFKQSFGGDHQIFYNFIRCNGLEKWLFELKDFYERFLQTMAL